MHGRASNSATLGAGATLRSMIYDKVAHKKNANYNSAPKLP
jgi:hypothetical protein